MRTVGLEIEVVDVWQDDVELLDGWKWNQHEAQLINSDLETCCYYGYFPGGEINSPPLTISNLKQELKYVLKSLKEQGAKVNFSTGIHVHVGLKDDDLTLGKVKALAYGASVWDTYLLKWANVGRARKEVFGHLNPFDFKLYEKVFKPARSLNEIVKNYPQRFKRAHRTATNLYSIFNNGLPKRTSLYKKNQTVEFRHFNGTLDYNEIVFLAEFVHGLVGLVLDKKKLDVGLFVNLNRLLSEIGIAKPAFPAPDDYFMSRERVNEIVRKCRQEASRLRRKDGAIKQRRN